mgnify:CR=1 FL=1
MRLSQSIKTGAALLIAPVTVRNQVVGHDQVLLTSNGGVNLLIGQQAQYGGRFGPLSETPQFEFDPTGETLLEADLGRELRPSQVSRELTGRALARLAPRPGGGRRPRAPRRPRPGAIGPPSPGLTTNSRT